MIKFDYSQVPYNYGACAADNCPKSSTCLQHLALEHAPAKPAFLLTLSPAAIKNIKGDCKYYRPNIEIRYAKGFLKPDRLSESKCRPNIPLQAYLPLRTQELLSCTQRGMADPSYRTAVHHQAGKRTWA